MAVPILVVPVTPPQPIRLQALGSAPGRVPVVRVFNEDGSLRFRVRAFSKGFRSGVRVLVGDLDGDGSPEVIAVPRGASRLPVKVFDGRSGALVRVLYAFGKGFGGRVSLSLADFNDDGALDLVAQAARAKARVFSGQDLSLTRLL